jgi:hypothetical protein
MSDPMSDSYIKDMKCQIKYVAQLAAAADDYDLAQQLYQVLFDLQLREEGTLARLGAMVDAPQLPHGETGVEKLRREERLRLVPTWPTRCLKCQRSDVVLRAGLCDACATRS